MNGLSARFGPSAVAATAALAALFSASSAGAADENAIVVRAPDIDSANWAPCPEFMPEGCAIAVLQGDPAERNADILFRLPGGATAPRHWHTSPERMVLVSGRMRVDYDGQEPKDAAEGDYLFGPARHPHSATCLGEKDCVLFIAFEEPVDAFAGAPEE